MGMRRIRPGPLAPISLPNLNITPLSYSLNIRIALARIKSPIMMRVKIPAPAMKTSFGFADQLPSHFNIRNKLEISSGEDAPFNESKTFRNGGL
jgi:hypothetical protein